MLKHIFLKLHLVGGHTEKYQNEQILINVDKVFFLRNPKIRKYKLLVKCQDTFFQVLLIICQVFFRPKKHGGMTVNDLRLQYVERKRINPVACKDFLVVKQCITFKCTFIL